MSSNWLENDTFPLSHPVWSDVLASTPKSPVFLLHTYFISHFLLFASWSLFCLSAMLILILDFHFLNLTFVMATSYVTRPYLVSHLIILSIIHTLRVF
ncbi:hypothetical protein L873DRAFT_766612 [Choiromyces venosus 120613-1]|uniref:Uncharacterized protein n=1 Tax=Choiromyces venosus 120613-1 TaxID=1336337 RepID=A0A3N4IT94_9PEZI|nr:hypothetical protein L873DRAFT_766612 [Choiromyces venosus 120613-1]